eukprot:CAMPEP_0205808824 /NCGR_PEP_ID=MMETSP0205-20121125/12866_1 /ASSEMBLY_ACC=CAM_ASM_000278 /TAXON_ID=36767 /ORGANISM="Euplotes focardii, Strain TN1" /LENGTH=57 /DNA_ID=CAMNT_0053085065 /DNA_START=590 /DNA_END=763 /DNA_ORIENTATION=+
MTNNEEKYDANKSMRISEDSFESSQYQPCNLSMEKSMLKTLKEEITEIDEKNPDEEY